MTAREEVKLNKKAEKAPARKAFWQTVEHIALAVVIASVIAFVAGMHYQNSVNVDKANAVKSAVQTAQTPKG